MERRPLGSLFDVSVLTLGGGGIGQVWGATDRSESVATVRAAYDAGITFFDVAPSYGSGEAETVIGEAFAGGYPPDVRVLTKCAVGMVAPDEVRSVLDRSLDESLQRLRRERVDVFLLHGAVVPDGHVPPGEERMRSVDVTLSFYEQYVRPALVQLVRDGRAGAWGFTAAGPLGAVRAVLEGDPAPGVAQCVVNLLDSPGNMHIDDQPPEPRAIVAASVARGVGVMGIRAVQAGALTDALDRDVDGTAAEAVDYRRAAPFRELAASWGVSAAHLAHRYALSMPGVDTVVLGVKNRSELADCVAAAEAGPLQPGEIDQIHASVGRAPSRTVPG
ncbi:MAG TPA: aldo/keto reductase [Candidatus Limnocylindria bacterium]|nr:aldo/keto reductase [Candidatus Limnocylindria bacterium]